MLLFHTCFVALNEQHTCAEASSEAIVGLHCGPLFVPHLPKDIWTHHLLSFFFFFSGPLLGGTKANGRLTAGKSLSITLFTRCLTGRQRGGRGGANGAEEAICSVLEEGWR